MTPSEIEIAKLRAQYITQILEIIDDAKIEGLDIGSILRDVEALSELPATPPIPARRTD